MKQDRQGYILNNNKNEWFFKPGRSRKSKHKSIPLLDCQNNIQQIVSTKLSFKGLITIKQVTKEKISNNLKNIHARRIYLAKSSNLNDITDESIKSIIHNTNLLTPNQHIFSSDKNIEMWLNNVLETPNICKKVSASNLDNHQTPHSLNQHDKLSTNDKNIWDAAYLEKHYVLNDKFKTWEYISEKEHQRLRPIIGRALPAYAISTIKKKSMEKL